MAELLAWMLGVFGFTYIVVYSKLLRPVRENAYRVSTKLGDLLHCPLCLGFWVGLLAHFVCGSPTHNFLFDACLGSITSWIGTICIVDMQTKFEQKYARPGCSDCGS